MTQGGEIGSGPVRIRRIVKGTGDGAVLVNGTSYVPKWDVGGRNGWVSGTLESRLYEEGTGTLRLPNAAGSDGQRHIDRLLCLSDPGYLPGDEWFEVYEGDTLVGCWTPTGRQSKRRSELLISGEDATTLLKRTREGTVGFWADSPRRLMDAYLRTWNPIVAEGFDSAGTQLTYSTSVQTTGIWEYQRAQTDQTNYPGVARLTSGGAGARPYLSGIGTPFVAYGNTGGFWRVEFEIIPETIVAGDWLRVGVGGTTFVNAVDVYYDKLIFDATNFAVPQALTTPLSAGVPLKIAIEGRDDTQNFYSVNGVLAFTNRTGSYALNGYPKVDGAGMANGSAVRIASISARQSRRLLMPADTGHPDVEGDKHLPGAPTPGGLWGKYFDLNPWVAGGGYGAGLGYIVPQYALGAGVATQPAAQRLDAGVNFASATPSTWRPPGVPAGYFGVRWTGSVYLDFDHYDYSIRTTATGAANDAAVASLASPTIWLNALTTNASAPSGTRRAFGPSGWYPLLIQYGHNDPAGAAQMKLEWMRSDAIGTWTAIPASALSPYGIYDDQIRNESHFDAFKNIADTFGYQWTCEPRSLESGEFPGRIIPRTRYGRDTEKVLLEPDATDIQADIDLDSRADSIQADASGLADATGASQLTAEGNDLPAWAQHFYIGQAYESLSDISQLKLLEQRLSTLVALRSAVWEEVSTRAPGRRELLDSWPLTGSLAEFAWAPGDGIRLNFPTVGVVDALPRQILGLSREFTPAGMRPPAASFRPRPRSVKSLLREIRRAALLPQRNYQQQLAQVSGSIAAGGGAAGGVDQYSRIGLPANPDDILSVWLAVLTKSNATSWNIEVNAVASTTNVTTIGRYDISSLVLAGPAGANSARLVAGGTGTGSWTARIEATVRV